MSNAIAWIMSCISSAVNWLSTWEYADIPFLYYLMGIAILGIILRFIF